MATYVCNKREKFIFISYSHIDNRVVLPEVLQWMRKGYNIYIDLDFENHGSEDFMYSHAAMIEIFTMRSMRTRRLRVEGDLSVYIVEWNSMICSNIPIVKCRMITAMSTSTFLYGESR